MPEKRPDKDFTADLARHVPKPPPELPEEFDWGIVAQADESIVYVDDGRGQELLLIPDQCGAFAAGPSGPVFVDAPPLELQKGTVVVFVPPPDPDHPLEHCGTYDSYLAAKQAAADPAAAESTA